MYTKDMFDAATITNDVSFPLSGSTSKDAADVESGHCSTWVSSTFT